MNERNNCGRLTSTPLRGEERRPRQARLAAFDTLPHVILRGIERRSIMADETDCREGVERLGRRASELKTAISARALPTNHAYLLLRSGG